MSSLRNSALAVVCLAMINYIILALQSGHAAFEGLLGGDTTFQQG